MLSACYLHVNLESNVATTVLYCTVLYSYGGAVLQVGSFPKGDQIQAENICAICVG